MFKTVTQYIKVIFSPKVFSEEIIDINNRPKQKINFFFFIFVSTIIIFLQFFASLLSIFHLPFRFLFFTSLVLSVVSSYYILKKNSFIIYVSKNILILSIFLVLASTFLFAIRVNWAYWDGSCPTYLTALVTQVSNGRFPVSFISFPEFPANYHQGFIYLSGVFSYWLKISPAYSIVISSTIIFFLIVLLLQFFFLKIKNRYSYLILPLFVLISSCSVPWFTEFGLYNYLSAFEYVVSNSWPVALLLLAVLMWYLQDSDTFNFKQLLGLTLFVLSSSTANATLYSVLFLALVILLFRKLLIRFRDDKFKIVFNKEEIVRLFVCFLLLGFVYLLPHHIPSAFLRGPQYDSTHLSFRFNSISQIGLSLGVVAYYLRLSGTISFLGILIALVYVVNSKKFLHQLLSMVLLVTFVFPLIFRITNVDTWDNIHKFAIINMFLSVILTVFFISQLKDDKIKKIILATVILSLLLSIRPDYDIFRYRTSLNIKKQDAISANYQDITAYLKRPYPLEVILLPFGSNNLCGGGDFGGIAMYSGAFVRNNYFKNFLLAEDLENNYEKKFYWWKDVRSFGDRLETIEPNEYVVIKNSEMDLFRKQIDKYNLISKQNKININSSTIKQFDYFTLYH